MHPAPATPGDRGPTTSAPTPRHFGNLNAGHWCDSAHAATCGCLRKTFAARLFPGVPTRNFRPQINGPRATKAPRGNPLRRTQPRCSEIHHLVPLYRKVILIRKWYETTTSNSRSWPRSSDRTPLSISARSRRSFSTSDFGAKSTKLLYIRPEPAANLFPIRLRQGCNFGHCLLEQIRHINHHLFFSEDT
jgi:hypothetical protein